MIFKSLASEFCYLYYQGQLIKHYQLRHTFRIFLAWNYLSQDLIFSLQEMCVILFFVLYFSYTIISFDNEQARIARPTLVGTSF